MTTTTPMTKDYFSSVVIDEALRAEILQKTPAAKTFVIHFTARSGSTWLAETLETAGTLGRPREYFNPGPLPNLAQRLQARTLETYSVMLSRQCKKGDVFSFEVTAHQINAVFGHYRKFHQMYGDHPCFWLIREDIVAQAISLAKMVKTNVAHVRAGEEQALASTEERFQYDGEFIRKWLLHIRASEKVSEAMFAEHSLSPMRLSYEQITAMPAHQVTNLVARHAGLPEVPLMEYPNPLQKLGSAQNESFANRFRQENADFLARIEEERAPMIELVQNVKLPLPEAGL